MRILKIIIICINFKKFNILVNSHKINLKIICLVGNIEPRRNLIGKCWSDFYRWHWDRFLSVISNIIQSLLKINYTTIYSYLRYTYCTFMAAPTFAMAVPTHASPTSLESAGILSCLFHLDRDNYLASIL